MLRPRARELALLIALILLAALFGSSAVGSPDARPTIDFGRDVQPILKAHCFQCHGGDQKQGGLRLDSRASAVKGGVSGPVIQPGNAGSSLLVGRILGTGGKPRMPLGFAPLADSQIAVLRAWIDQGAAWPEAAAGTHWAYVKPVRPRMPLVKNAAWVRNPIDAFVLARLEREGLKPSPEADRTTLIRRVTLDLTGLPPTPHEVDAFVLDRSPNAYEKVVDRLIANPRYGERSAKCEGCLCNPFSRNVFNSR